MVRFIRAIALLPVIMPAPSLAWGYEGHKVVALIARSNISPATRAKVDAILAADPDTLTAPDMASRATWADAWRSAGHRETAQWHFVDTELDVPDLKDACFGFPAQADPASAGPAQDCAVDKIRAFTAELAAPAELPAERLLALKFVLHFVGDVHQPLHASDNHDRGGNCVLLAFGGSRTVNLHAYWDTVAVEALDRDPDRLAARLGADITPAQRAIWRRGDAADWAQEAYQVATSTVYRIGSPSGCGSDAAPIALPTGYDVAAQAAVSLQLKRAGIRLAAVLDQALANVPLSRMPAALPMPSQGGALPPARTRTPVSLECSAKADMAGLHGKDRQRFRRACMRVGS